MAKKSTRTKSPKTSRATKAAKPSPRANASKAARVAKAGAKATRPAARRRPARRGVAPHVDPVALAAPRRPFLAWSPDEVVDAAALPAAGAAAVPMAAAAPARLRAAAAAPAAVARAFDEQAMGQIQLSVFDGARQPFNAGGGVLVTVHDGHEEMKFRGSVTAPRVAINLPLQDNLTDNFIVNVSASGFQQSGFSPVLPKAGTPAVLDLMLLPSNPAFDFTNASWNALQQSHPDWITLFSQGAASPQAAQARYEALMHDREGSLACLLNLVTAMQAIILPQLNPLAYFKGLIWDDRMAIDRFYAFADPELIRQCQIAVQQKTFAPEPSPGIFHKGATRSFKQTQFGEANVQLTFHENDAAPIIDGVQCVVVEPDIDYFKDLTSHFLLEVVPGFFSLTDPHGVYVLRWIAGRSAHVADFNPPYTIVPA